MFLDCIVKSSNGEASVDSAGCNNKSVIGFQSAKLNDLIKNSFMKKTTFNELAPGRFLTKLAFGSLKKISCLSIKLLSCNWESISYSARVTKILLETRSGSWLYCWHQWGGFPVCLMQQLTYNGEYRKLCARRSFGWFSCMALCWTDISRFEDSY